MPKPTLQTTVFFTTALFANLFHMGCLTKSDTKYSGEEDSGIEASDDEITEPSAEDSAYDSGWDPGEELDNVLRVTNIYAYSEAFIHMGTDPYVDGGVFQIVLAGDDWQGPSDRENACFMEFEVASGFSHIDEDAPGWIGWEFNGAILFIDSTPSCNRLEDEDWQLFKEASVGNFGMGLGPLCQDELWSGQNCEDTFSEVFTESGFEWNTEVKPYLISQYVKLDFGYFGSTDWFPTNYAYVYETEENNSVVTYINENPIPLHMSAASSLDDGYVVGFPYFGFAF